MTADALAARVPASRRERHGWYFYDWANSAFSATVVTVFFGPYLNDVAEHAADRSGHLHVLGMAVRAKAYFPFVVALSVLLTVFLAPVVGAVADRSQRKKELLAIFAYVGAGATVAMFAVQGGAYVLGGVLLVVANVAFSCSIVVYNAFLPEIAGPDERDAVSARGWALGYLGGGLLLALNLALYTLRARLGVSAAFAVRVSLASAGVWWALFTLIPLRALRRRRPAVPAEPGVPVLVAGFRQLGRTLLAARGYPRTMRFLLAYLIYNDGIQTVIVLASVYAAAELHLGQTTRVAAILLVQFVAMGGAIALGRMARRVGAKRTVLGSLVVWAAALGLAYFLPARKPLAFFALAALIGVVLGGSQALSRSMFSQLIPAGQEAEYFSLYEISERGTSWLGTLMVGLIYNAAASYRPGIVSLVAFFIVGGVLLALVDVRRAVVDAGNVPPARL